MRRKIGVGAVVALLAAVPSAGAAPWYYDWQPIPAGRAVTLPLASTEVTVTFKSFRAAAMQFDCSMTGSETFWNEGTTGRDRFASASFACPPGDSVVASPPWGSTLIELVDPEHDPFRDRQEGVVLSITCGGVDRGVFTGTLEPVYGDLDPLSERETRPHDEADSFLTFRNYDPASPLQGPGGAQAWMLGKVAVGSHEAFVTDESGVF